MRSAIHVDMNRSISRLLVTLGSTLSLAACSAAPETSFAEDTGDTATEALGQISRCTHANMASSSCAAVRAQILNDAPQNRVELLNRGLDWVDRDIMYSQSKTTDGYRRDCSGFVSMVWGESQTYSTASYAPYDTSATTQLASYEDLLPGDALNKVPRGHIVLFAGWANNAHTAMYVLEESQTGSPALLAKVSATYFARFRPIRSNNL